MKARSRSVPLTVAAILLGVFAVLLEAQPMKRQPVRQENRSDDHPGAPQVIAANHRDTPLTIRLYRDTGIDPYEPKVQLRVINNSDKPISAYAIKYDLVVNGKSGPGGLELTHISAARSLLQPGTTNEVSLGDAHYSLPIERLIVSVDFVEFVDGSSWGADSYSSGVQLEGIRVGARYAAEHFLHLLATRGPKVLSTSLDQTENDLLPSVDSPAKWKDGFKRGVEFVRERARREIKDFSPEEIRKSLSSPIDALDEIRRNR